MENLIKTATGVPKMAEDVLQVNVISSTLNDVESNPNRWIGLSYQVASLFFLIYGIYTFLLPFIDDGLNDLDGKEGIGLLVGLIISLYAAFPMSRVIRNTGEALASSNSSILVFIFKDFILANIRMAGQLLALAALFSAVALTLTVALDIPILTGKPNLIVIDWMTKIPLAAASDFANFFGFENLANTMLNGVLNWDVSNVVAPEPQKIDGLIAVLYAFGMVIVTLVQMHILIGIYSGLYGLGTSFLNYLKSPYWPVKSV